MQNWQIITTHTHPFNGPLSGTARVSRYQKGKTNLDFTEARDSEWQWHPLGHMQVCTSLQSDNHASTPPLKFLQAGCPSCCPTNSIRALMAHYYYCSYFHFSGLFLCWPHVWLYGYVYGYAEHWGSLNQSQAFLLKFLYIKTLNSVFRGLMYLTLHPFISFFRLWCYCDKQSCVLSIFRHQLVQMLCANPPFTAKDSSSSLNSIQRVDQIWKLMKLVSVDSLLQHHYALTVH